MKKNGIISGLILVAIGVVILLKSFDLICFSWWTLWRLWPFSFIFVGIGIMPIKKMWKGIFYVIAILACVATMSYMTKHNSYGRWGDRLRNFFDKRDIKELKEDFLRSDQISYLGFSDSITRIKVNAEFVSGNYLFETKPYNSMLRFTFQGNSYSTSLTEEGTTGFLELLPKEWDNRKSSGKIYLYEKFDYTFTLQGEKSDISLDAAKLNIDTLNINAGDASSWNITLSASAPETYLFITAHPDAGNINLTLPASSGYQFITSAIADTTQWNNLQPAKTGTYLSDNFKEAKQWVFIESNSRNVEVRR
ncbi:MAG: DUF5668 domain-containing protein [Bacteroidales bacterium]|nr:DUF5668 domain-containing protein [Bacteroidales bacterium]